VHLAVFYKAVIIKREEKEGKKKRQGTAGRVVKTDQQLRQQEVRMLF